MIGRGRPVVYCDGPSPPPFPSQHSCLAQSISLSPVTQHQTNQLCHTVEPPIMDTLKSGQPRTNCLSPNITSEEGTTFEQWTKHLSLFVVSHTLPPSYTPTSMMLSLLIAAVAAASTANSAIVSFSSSCFFSRLVASPLVRFLSQSWFSCTACCRQSVP